MYKSRVLGGRVEQVHRCVMELCFVCDAKSERTTKKKKWSFGGFGRSISCCCQSFLKRPRSVYSTNLRRNYDTNTKHLNEPERHNLYARARVSRGLFNGRTRKQPCVCTHSRLCSTCRHALRKCDRKAGNRASSQTTQSAAQYIIIYLLYVLLVGL